jgi:hypothetical protein
MSKKDLAKVTTDLSALASLMPTQRPHEQPPLTVPAYDQTLPREPKPANTDAPEPAKAPKPKQRAEETIQFSLSLRKSLRKQLARLADDAELTMRAFVLNALKDKGLSVRDDDLADLRKR